MARDGEELPEGETIHVMHSQGDAAYILVREGAEIVCYTANRRREVSRTPMTEDDRVRLASSYRALRSAAQT